MNERRVVDERTTDVPYLEGLNGVVAFTVNG